MMYEGSLYQLPLDWNAANMYLNTKLLEESGLSYPAAEWTKDDFYNMAKTMTKAEGGPPFGYGWVNRLWGGWMPWIFVNGSNLLTEARAPGGEWVWSTFYADDPSAQDRGGGWRWEAPQANAPEVVEALEFVVQLANEGVTPAVSAGGGDLLQGFFTSNNLGMTPAGGFWAGGLHNAGMPPDGFDVQLFPQWKSQRHQFGTAGLVMLSQSGLKDIAWEYMKYYVSKDTMKAFFVNNPTTPSRRSMMTEEQYATTGPAHWQVFYDTLDQHPDTAPIPAPPQSNEMTSIFMRYTDLAMTGERTPKEALDGMQGELEALFAQS
jgi:ABC-type glycerol-3-phosphate transport system substrate-binding protein